MLHHTLSSFYIKNLKILHEGISQTPLTLLSLSALPRMLLINTLNFFASPYSNLSLLLACSLWRMSTQNREERHFIRGGKSKSVALTCLWQSDCSLVVSDARHWRDVWEREGRRQKNFEVPKRAFWQEQRRRFSVAFRGAGLKMGSAGRCPHPLWSNLASDQHAVCHVMLLIIKRWHTDENGFRQFGYMLSVMSKTRFIFHYILVACCQAGSYRLSWCFFDLIC